MHDVGDITVSTHVLRNFEPQRHVPLLAAAGIHELELSCNTFPVLRAEKAFSELRALLREHGMRVWSVHSPFSGTVAGMERLDIASEDAAERETAVDSAKLCLKRLRETGGRCLVIHPSCGDVPEAQRKRRTALCIESLARLAESLPAGGSVKIAVENLPPGGLADNSEAILELLAALGDEEKFGICLDVNHANLSEELMSAAARCAPRVITTHVSDNDGIRERHWLPGRGAIPIRAWMAFLRRQGYSGPFVYETTPSEAASAEETIRELILAARSAQCPA